MITVFLFHQKVQAAKAKLEQKQKMESNPLVRFRYDKGDLSWNIPMRTVRLISADSKYFWGLEMKANPKTGKMSYMPKRFLRSKVREFNFLNFNVGSMP